ncbi:MAG: Nif3-like dinuclear metal center hexameric protein [Armatimonadota bacterium]
MTLTVRDIQRRLDRLAPPVLAEQWDNVGLLVGDPAQEVRAVVVALDATHGALAQAEAQGANLLVVHHPLIFSGLKRLVEDGGINTLVRRLVASGISLLAYHTNLDSAPEGLNQYVGQMLGLQSLSPLLPSEAHPLVKLVVYVPEAQVDVVREAICRAGAGQIGRYSECTFGAPGIGTFRPEEGANPYIGMVGELERVAEIRLETVVPKPALRTVLDAMVAAHPYEEVAYDLFSLEKTWPGAGLGRIGTLPSPTTAGAFLQQVRHILQVQCPALIGDLNREVTTVALCTGAGGDFAEQARYAGADLYLTGEVKHHQALLARQHGFAIIDAGHYPTERPAVSLIAGYLEAQFPELVVVRAEEKDPITR